MSARHRFIATAPRGLTDLLARELSALGAEQLVEAGGSVRFEGTLAVGYRACLWSRVASRVLLCLAELQAESADEFYRLAGQIEWESHVSPGGTLACDFSGTHPGITNSHFGALRLKDAVVDRLRERFGSRPQVQLSRPAVRLHAHARGARITVAVDLSGESLHRRGYRLEAGEAPLRESLAAGVLLRARWDEAAAAGREFLDPLCGSGTLVIEAAMIAAQRAPGLQREYFGFLGWRAHDEAQWHTLCEEARAQARASLPNLVRGSDLDGRVLQQAQQNALRADVAALVRFERGALAAVRPLGPAPGMICTNPPYGERLGDEAGARALHAQLGQVLREYFAGWDAAILTAAPQAARELRLRSYRVHELWNGPIACRLLRIDLAAPGATDLMHRPAVTARTAQESIAAQPAPSAELSVASPPSTAGAAMFANRLEKNLRRLGRAARAAQVSCYRLYDADMPEYAFAIDRYEETAGTASTAGAADEAARVHLYVQEYAAPASIDVDAARRRRREALSVLPATLAVAPERIHLRVRRPQRGAAQYQPRRADAARRDGPAAAPLANMLTVSEAGLKFLVNLDDYLDTGLFLDHRSTRALLRERARGRRFLNLFCYTASATVCAAAGGARESLSIDMSNRYLQWAEANLQLNGVDPAQHRLLQADCLAWLQAGDDAQRDARAGFDLIFLDPPTFSNSKRMQGVLDVQRDHLALIGRCMQRLAPGGTLIFSTNAQRFKLDAAVAERWRVLDLSRRTLPFDFQDNPRIHRCYEINGS
ncbi:MAG TPA: bifunctional 23S rRNA (guanine(2069)-N(7))-methyltransferase RlmK/23S rRNA (guanine(2445)-N(2))-methyltransferase RlmL [Steroidobacteraceae bacterium]|nr:bifunctional 23S rRNA (guanine(2069)-N(7))-methyltransferase RlmK/23S rRNA (guanine(2445)-N(2))-methyltransferase RlmL [Steroidobacteraceae bacterium]